MKRRRRLAPALLAFLSTAAAWTVAGPTASPERIDGERLARQLRSSPPQDPVTLRGRLNVRDSSGNIRDVPFQFKSVVTPTNWLTIYRASPVGTNISQPLAVIHGPDQPNTYWEAKTDSPDSWVALENGDAAKAFAGSDFTIADLGLEFLHWPTQKLARVEMRKSRSCHVLESSRPADKGWEYVRVLSWVDVESGGILVAEAYDASNKLLKEFVVNKVKNRQVEQMEIRNAQARSRTRLDFEVQ
ncbi:MAG: outer membrane lipoprotein-sorting protein [Verrucomicrobia bacterium]|nr:outer membrane lipoprotein-sorting protein [Verrucomicrobiota bacterium]MBI3867477.1 outer membrane lipoprotein-sorting protein [Verrucomicrobiota bacterium]